MKNLKEMSIEDLKKNRDILEEEQAILLKESESLSKSIQMKMKTIKKINEIIDENTLTIDDHERLLEQYPDTRIKRELREEMLSQWNLGTHGYFLETDQVAIQITLYRRDEETLHAAYDGIKKLLYLIKPIKNKGKIFSIFEKTLCEFGVYQLVINKGVHQVIKTTRNRDTIKFSSNNLMAALKYIQQNHFYEGTPSKYVTKKLYAWRKKIKEQTKEK